MSVLLTKILWTPQSSTIAVNITDAVNMNVSRGLEIKNNIVSFTLRNNEYAFNSTEQLLRTHLTSGFDQRIKEDDNIKIYLHYSDDFAEIEDNTWADNNLSPSSDYLKGSYFVIDIDPQQNISLNTIKITAADKTYILFNRLLAEEFPLNASSGSATSTTSNKLVDSGADFTNSANVGMTVRNKTDNTYARVTAIDSDNTLSISDDIFVSGEDYSLQWTAPSILQKVVRFSSQNSKGLFQGTGNDSGVTYDVDARMETDESGFIQDVRKNTYEDGSSNIDLLFPGKSISKIWKPVYEWVSELSQLEYLNTTDELENNSGKKLVYGRRFLSWVDEDNVFHWQETSSTEDLSIDVGTDDVYDYNIGRDGSDVINFIVFRGGEDFYGNGTLDYVVDTSVDAKIKKMHVVGMTDIAIQLIEGEIALGNLIENTTGSFTFSGNRYNRNGTVIASWNGESYSNDSDYNSALRTEINRVGRNRSRSIIQGRNTSRLKGTLERKGQIYNAGNLIRLTNRNVGHINQLIRIQSINDTVNASGWYTTLQLEQDDEAIIALES